MHLKYVHYKMFALTETERDGERDGDRDRKEREREREPGWETTFLVAGFAYKFLAFY